jgi:hypothetical protein
MPRIRLFHWNAAEAKPLIDQLRAGGYTVDYRNDKALGVPFRSLRESPLHAIVIDLTRLPSRGRHHAVAIRSEKTIRSIPIVFVDGDPEKVERIRAELPDAIYTSCAKVRSALKRAKPLVNPASPPYSNRTTAQKLSIREGLRVAVVDAPRGYAKTVGTLPAGASFEEDPADVLPVTLWFVREPEEYLAALPRMRELAGKSRLWVIYPKQQARQKASAEITLFFIRDAALRVGLVHCKTCSVDKTWTGMALALSKA